MMHTGGKQGVMKLRTLASSSFVLGLVACSQGADQPADPAGQARQEIVNGRPLTVAESRTSPAVSVEMARFDFTDINNIVPFPSHASGVLIDENVVLTAAHVVVDKFPEDVIDYFGTVIAHGNGSARQTRKIRGFPRFFQGFLRPLPPPPGSRQAGFEFVNVDLALFYLDAPITGVNIPNLACAPAIPNQLLCESGTLHQVAGGDALLQSGVINDGLFAPTTPTPFYKAPEPFELEYRPVNPLQGIFG